MKDGFIKIGEAAKILNVNPQTLRRWEESGKLSPHRTVKGTRLYSMKQLNSLLGTNGNRLTLAYILSGANPNTLDDQRSEVEEFCAKYGWSVQVISDVGSNLDYSRSGLTKLLNHILDGDVWRLVLKDRESVGRFSSSMLFKICVLRNIEVVIISDGGFSFDSLFH